MDKGISPVRGPNTLRSSNSQPEKSSSGQGPLIGFGGSRGFGFGGSSGFGDPETRFDGALRTRSRRRSPFRRGSESRHSRRSSDRSARHRSNSRHRSKSRPRSRSRSVTVYIENSKIPESDSKFTNEAIEHYNQHCQKIGISPPEKESDIADQAVRYWRSVKEDEIAQRRDALPVYSASLGKKSRPPRTNSELINHHLPANQRFTPLITAAAGDGAQRFLGNPNSAFFSPNVPTNSNVTPLGNDLSLPEGQAAWQTAWSTIMSLSTRNSCSLAQQNEELKSKNAELIATLNDCDKEIKKVVNELLIQRDTFQKLTESCERAYRRADKRLTELGPLQNLIEKTLMNEKKQ